MLSVIAHTSDKKTDWEKVSKMVIKTHPKCSSDVPDMVEWFKKFGGGTSKVFVPVISAMFDKFVEHTRMVSGGFFKSLAGLKFAADEATPTHIVLTLIHI